MRNIHCWAMAAALLIPSLYAAPVIAGPEVRCKVCHSFKQDARRKSAPNLFGVVGRKAGTTKGYPYSRALKESGIIWTEENLVLWIQDSPAMVPGTKMSIRKFGEKEARRIVEYLKTLK